MSTSRILELVVKESAVDPPNGLVISVGSVSKYMQAGLSMQDIARLYGVDVSMVYRKARLHPRYHELKRVAAMSRARLVDHVTYKYWKPGVERRSNVERAYNSCEFYAQDFKSPELFLKAMKAAVRKNPSLQAI